MLAKYNMEPKYLFKKTSCWDAWQLFR